MRKFIYINLYIGVTRKRIKAELGLLMKMLKEASILMRRLVVTTSIEELWLEARKPGILASMIVPLALGEGKLLRTRTLEKMCKG